MAEWSSSYVSSLPDSSFAYIAPGGKKDGDGKTMPRNLRYLPYKDADGKPDEAHVRNALSRLPQTDIPDSAKASAKKKLLAAAKQLGIEVSDDGKSFDATIKALTTTKRFMEAEVKALEDTTRYPNGGFIATLSMPSLDRDDEIIDAGAFNPLPNSIPIFGDHVASVATTVARARPYYEGNQLKAEGWFDQDDYSQLVRNKVKNGFVPTMSVGYMSPMIERDEIGIPHTKSAELLEASFTPIPSLREATVQQAKSAIAGVKAGARNSKDDAARLQQAHDHIEAAEDLLEQLGAKPSGDDVGEDDADDTQDGKSMAELHAKLGRLLDIAERDSGEIGTLALQAALHVAQGN